MLARNTVLLLASLFFYSWGEPRFVFVMLLSIVANYGFGVVIGNCTSRKKRTLLILCLAFNLSILFVFKYLNFVVANINSILPGAVHQTSIVLPIGISFFTFQAISYVVDVYRGTVPAQRNPLYVALYIAFFPQLIAGPIIRYSTIEEQIVSRKESVPLFAEGIRRFLIGFSKKIILANSFALIADQAFEVIQNETLSVSFAWLGSIAYTLQIFFDFSAYSDMAIGLGAMFGFRYPENFDYPYGAKTITEFWRRWHISLGMWFRDYVYFPLGGSRVDTRKRLVFNLFVVWLLTGIWHGANWTFICWGLLYFILLCFEKLVLSIQEERTTVLQSLYRVFTLLCVNAGWVLFRAESIGQAAKYFQDMMGIRGGALVDDLAIQNLGEYWLFLAFGLVYSVGLFQWARSQMENTRFKVFVSSMGYVVYFVLFVIALSYLVMGAYNPFIYFNF